MWAGVTAAADIGLFVSHGFPFMNLGFASGVWRCIGGWGHLGTYVPPPTGEGGEAGRNLSKI